MPQRVLGIRGLMTSGTVASRVSGFIRLIVLTWALGTSAFADAFNLANTIPNSIHDLVLGGVVSASFVPIFVAHLSLPNKRLAWRSISSVATIAFAVLIITTALFWVLARPTVLLFVAAGSGGRGALEISTAVTLLRYFILQLFFYGVISVSTSILNAVGNFVRASFAPIINNIIAISVLVAFHYTAGSHVDLRGHLLTHGASLALLGAGTTAGVAAQALFLWPALRRSGANIRLRFRLRDPVIGEIVASSGWIMGIVMLNQVAFIIVQGLAFDHGKGVLSSYQYGYQFFQLPFGIVGVTSISMMVPSVARALALADGRALLEAIRRGGSYVIGLVLPASVGMLVLAGPIIDLTIGHGALRGSGAAQTGRMLAAMATGVAGFTFFLYCIRVLQAMRQLRLAFWLYVLENGLNIVTAYLLIGWRGGTGLGISLALSYDLASVVGVLALHRLLPAPGLRLLWPQLSRVALTSALVGGIVWLERSLIQPSPAGAVILGGATAVAGLVAVVKVAEWRAQLGGDR